MNIQIIETTTILTLLLNVGEINGLSIGQNSSSSVNGTSIGSFVHNGKPETIIQTILNQTTDLETLKSTQLLLNHIVEFENYKHQSEKDKATIQLLLNQTADLENLKKQSEIDRSTIQFLLNQSKELENLKQQSEKDRSMIQLLLNQSMELENLKQLSEKDRTSTQLLQNVTERLVGKLNDIQVQIRYMSMSLLDIHSVMEKMNESIIRLLEDEIKDVRGRITSMYNLKCGLYTAKYL